jgi:hypothetical protein
MYGNGDKKMIWYNVYHNHPGMGGMFTTKHILSLAGTPLASSRLYCTFCREDTPDVVDGFMNMIKWSEENAD